MNRPLGCAAAVAVLLLAGCGTRGGSGPMPGHGASGRPAEGRVTGRLLLEGGPIRPDGRQPGPRPIRGVLTVSNGAAVTDSGQLLSGREWERSCSFPLSVTVTARHTTRAAVICPVP